MSRAAKFFLLTALYFAQGLPFGFFVQALPVLLREQGLSLPAIGGTYFLALPWALKFLWAPWVDRTDVPLTKRGRYRGWILAMQALSIGLLVICGQLDPARHLAAVLVCVLFTNLLAATQDIATDALAVRLLDDDERGLGNGIQVAGYRVGMIVGGGAILVAYGTLGWRWSFVLMAGLIVLASAVMWAHREPEGATVDSSGEGPVDWWRFLRLPGMGRWVLVLVLLKAPDAFTTGMLRPFMVDIGFSLDDIGTLVGGYGFVTGLLGALFGGWMCNVLGRRRAVLSMTILQVLALISYVPSAAGVGPFVEAPYFAFAISVDHFFGGAATAAIFTMMMDRARKASAGSDYTIQASVVVLAAGVFGAGAGISAHVFGHGIHLVIGTAASALAWAVASHLLSQPPGGQP